MDPLLDRFKPTFHGVKLEPKAPGYSEPAARSTGAIVTEAPGPLTLRVLEAELYKVVTVRTKEIKSDPAEGDSVGKYVFRDDDGEKFMWGSTPLRYEHHPVGTIQEADHIDFLCPLCFARNGGAKGTHHVMVTFAGRDVPDEAGSRDQNGKPSRWTIAGGSSLDDLVLTPSILLNESQPPDVGCHWHGFVGSSGVPAGHAG